MKCSRVRSGIAVELFPAYVTDDRSEPGQHPVQIRGRSGSYPFLKAAWRAAGCVALLAILSGIASGGTFVAFGPQQYVRSNGAPAADTRTFTVLDPTTTFTMRIDSSGVSSAIVSLNGAVIFKESDFNATVKLLTKTVTLLPANQLSVELRGKPGESLTIQINGVDNAPPTITAVVSPAPNAAGWNRSDATVSFTCSDKTSGIATCTAPSTVTLETAGQTVAGTAVDKAGNIATAVAVVKLDKTPPSLNVTSPANGSNIFFSPVAIGGTIQEALSGLASVTCNGIPASVNGANFSCNVTLTPGANSINTIATDVAGNISPSSLSLTYTRAPIVRITSPANLSYLNISPTTVNGTVDDPTATVTVNSVPAAVVNGSFSVALPLAEGPNIVTASATSGAGASGTSSIEVTLDTTPPHVTITSPPDQFVTTEASISVAGNVNDIVVGTVNSEQAQVAVNAVTAQVANRTFLAVNVPLALGTNVIQAVGRDRVGNAATTQIVVTRQTPTLPQIRLISGNNQTGAIGSVLPAPLVVAVTDAAGNPVPNKPVIFKVVQDDGMVNSGGPLAATVIATTNGQGQAQAQWKLGMRAGAGGNSVEAYSVGFSGTAIFTATGTQGPAGKIVIDTGNDQIGAANQPLPRPLIAVVIDAGNNRLAGVPVTFTVKQGGGSFGGQPTFTVNTDSDGRVAATLTLGLQEGNANNLVEATFPSNTSFPVSFTASGRVPGNPSNTTISGVVLDNSNVPIPGVTIRAVLTNLLHSNSNIIQSVAAIQTNAQGQFTILQAPVGFVKLLVDGSTAQRPGTYPTLDYDLVTVAGQNNTLSQPIYLLALNANNQLCVTPTTGGGTLTIPEAPGFSLTFGPGQVTFPGGSKTGCVSVTVVHGDKVPMVPGFGQQPRFIVTIQPAGAVFNPPAAITLPNVDGLKPRAVTEMYSFDHDIGSFVAIGTGVVSDDGRVIRSSPGVGVLKAGWHCGGDPNQVGSAATCPSCQICQGSTCVTDTAKNGQICSDNDKCTENDKCANGSCAGSKVPDTPFGTTTSVTWSVKELAQSPVGKFLEFIEPEFGQESEKLNFAFSGSGKSATSCCKASQDQEKVVELEGGFQASGTIEIPLAGPALIQKLVTKVVDKIPVFGDDVAAWINKNFKLGIFFKAGVAGGGFGRWTMYNCPTTPDIVSGGFNLGLTAALTADAKLADGKIIGGSVALSSGATCSWTLYTTEANQPGAKNSPPCQWSGVSATVIFQLFDGRLEIAPTFELISGGVLGDFSFVIPVQL